MTTIVHCADIHAGRPASLKLGPEKALIRRREIEDTLFRIIEIAREEKADLLLISGDLFEHCYARPSWAREAAEALGSIPDTKVFVAPGNHDPALKDSLYRSITWPRNVTAFLSSSIREVILDDLGLAIYGRGWTAYQDTDAALMGFRVRRKDLLNLMLIHGEVVQPGLTDDSGYLPVHPDHVSASGLDYLALGHVHSPSRLRMGDTTVVYPGCPEPLDFGDKGPRGIYIVNAKKSSRGEACAEAEFMPIALRQMRSVEVDITGLDTDERVRNAILDVDDATGRNRDLWSVTLIGRVDPEISFEIPSFEKDLSDEFFSLRISTEYWPDYDLQELAEDEGSLEGRFLRHLQEVAADKRAKGDSRGAETAELAIYYGLDALRQGKVLLRGRRWN